MKSPITRDTLLSQIPSHILESYPNFVAFLEGYYEWINEEGNPYQRIKNHLGYLDFQDSIDAYIDFMKNEYLTDVPDNVLLDRELFIKWSKKFNIARGSHYSYKFLFSLLYDEQDTEIYLPKDNILRTSDGTWISNEFKLIVTNSGSIADFQLSRIVQEREIVPGVFEYAYANVQSAVNRYSGQYNVIEVTVSDIEGVFESGYPIRTESGAEEWLIDTVTGFQITNGGSGYTEGSRVVFDGPVPDYVVTYFATTNGRVDTRVTGLFNEAQLTLRVNNNLVNDFVYDGRYITSNAINIGDTVEISFPPYLGYMTIGCTCSSGQSTVTDISILETPIGVSQNQSLSIDSNIGTGFSGQSVSDGYLSPVDGYYLDNKGQLSSTMYLQDSFYYQEYSYAIRTQQSIENYGAIVKQTLHPAGFALFGYLRILDLIELIISLVGDEYNVSPFETESRAKYSLGANYSFFDRFKHGLSGRLYNMSHFQDKPYVDAIIEPRVYMDDGIIEDLQVYVESDVYVPGYSYRFDMEMAVGQESEYLIDGIIENDESYVESVEYDLSDSTLEKTWIAGVGGYHEPNYIEPGYYNDKGSWVVDVKGWMTKHYLQDYFLYIPQEYSDEVESGDSYFETGYVSERS